MAVTFVYSILAVLVTIIVSTTSCPPNVHGRMTRAERISVFGSEDSIPEYEVFPMSLSRTRRSVKSHKKIKLKLKLNGKKIVLNLKPTAGYLATKYTPVWSAKNDKHAYKYIRYDPLPKAMRNIGKFKMYHDVKHEAAITVYTDRTNETILEGVVTPYYAIRSLPKRLMKTTLKIGDYLIRTSTRKKRLIISDAEEDTGYFVLLKVPATSENATQILVHDLHREKRANDRNGIRKVPKVVYPEILIVLDHNALRHHTITQALRFTLAFWNGVDLVYSVLNEPKVRLNIAGIIISADAFATPYIAINAAATTIGHMNDLTLIMETYFYDEKVRLPVKKYDMIVAMTTSNICDEGLDSCHKILGTAVAGAACGSLMHFKTNMQSTALGGFTLDRGKGTALVHYSWNFGGVDTAIHETAHLFGVEHDEGKGKTADCGTKEHVMAPDSNPRYPFKWSSCSRNYFKTYFSSMESKCLDNKPLWSKPVKKILPGRWLSMNGQCQNYGYEKSCKLKKISKCVELGCRNGRSKCIRQRQVPLPGSRCGRNKYCNSKKRCVRK